MNAYRNTVAHHEVSMCSNLHTEDFNAAIFVLIISEAQCVYSDWMTVSDCSVTCGSGYKTEVRSFLKVKDKTPGSKDCKEDLERYKKCELSPCK